MKRAIVAWLYGRTMREDWIAGIIATVLFRWYCPYPLLDDWTARTCIREGLCGCNNTKRR